MPSNKNRLYVGLFARAGAAKMPGKEDRYHWGLLVGPKEETPDTRCRQFHAKETMTWEGDPPTARSVWHYQEESFPVVAAGMLLVRVVVGKIRSMARLQAILASTPMRPDVEGWNCVGWVQEAFTAAVQDGKTLGTSVADWPTARDAAMAFVEKKKAAHRFDGKGAYDMTRIATYDALGGHEVTP